jgi:hypothetical protein
LWALKGFQHHVYGRNVHDGQLGGQVGH